MKNATKLLFAHALETELKSTTFNKVRVTTLCRQCQASPQTFYNHFRDKYDLVAWFYEQDVRTARQRAPHFTAASIAEQTRQLLKKKSFYQKVYVDNSQNSINKYIFHSTISWASLVVEQARGQRLTAKEELAIKYHTYGTLALFKDLLFDQITMPIDQLAEFEYQRVPRFLREALQANHRITAIHRNLKHHDNRTGGKR